LADFTHELKGTLFIAKLADCTTAEESFTGVNALVLTIHFSGVVSDVADFGFDTRLNLRQPARSSNHLESGTCI